MSEFIESLQRLYSAKRITDTKITELFENEKITEKELNYILGKEDK